MKRVDGDGDGDSGVGIVFSDGSVDRFNIVVRADGQGSRTRRMILDDVDGVADPVHSIGVYRGYFTIHQNSQEGDDKSNNTNKNKKEEYNATVYLATQNRGIITPQHTPHKHQIYLFCKRRRLSTSPSKPSPKQSQHRR